ncbi:LysR substrate-binding domain-containing protein [Bradyrhizobium vignae]|uniref:LysR substrate-binding domain-containing protein n=1 Tax=Bradyrhizobium vignae TaxID=1549949 RepID=UPI0013E89BD9|nr:LysR substrate-binding domain-containing protein [Bradyrhizobium vignae]
MNELMPPLNPLHVFDVTARLGSFTKAAEKMRVTQPAISRQIRTLENFLGVQLFERDRQGAKITPTGEQFHRQISPALQIISRAATNLTEMRRIEPLRVRAYTTFASKWLIPRLPSFYVAYPKIKLDISNVVAPVDFARDRIDLAIQFGNGRWPAAESELLFKDLIQPVCSPKLLKRVRLVELDDLNNVQLLHSHYRRTDWHDWLAAVQRTDLLSSNEVSFSSSVLTYQAAIAGVGVAIGQIHLLKNELDSRMLVPLFNAPLERKLAHYVVWPKNRPLNRRARSFLSWLRVQLRDFSR